MIDDVLAMQADLSEIGISDDSAAEEDSEFEEAADGKSITGNRHASHNIGRPRLDPAKADRADAEYTEEEFPETDFLNASDEPGAALPKIALVEIESHTDPLFLNIVSRHIATARNEDRTVCLVALRVESDAEAGSQLPCRPNGLPVWQEKLVDWLADHPQVHEPFAFVSRNGQLVVSMLDVERTVATNILREGLVVALNGKPADEDGSLARVAIPCRYYCGIGSVSAPNARFAAEQLIDATWRCLSAAQSQGKATIKSIEVF